MLVVYFPHLHYFFYSYSIFKLQFVSLFGLLLGTNGLEPSTSRLSGVRSNHLSYAPKMINLLVFVLFPRPFGGDEEDRTPDPLRARQVLSQLSYTPIKQGLRFRLLPMLF